jgi:hypothetical protein
MKSSHSDSRALALLRGRSASSCVPCSDQEQVCLFWFHQEQNIVAGRAMNKALEDENSWLSGES